MKLMRQTMPLSVESKEDALMSCEWNGTYQMLSGSMGLIRKYQLRYKQDIPLHCPWCGEYRQYSVLCITNKKKDFK